MIPSSVVLQPLESITTKIMENQRKITFSIEAGLVPTLKNDNIDTSVEDALKANFNMVHLIEFTGNQIKLQNTKFEADHIIDVMKICPAYHGGPLDYPKVTTYCVGQVIIKWDLCYEKLLKDLQDNPNPSVFETETKKNFPKSTSASMDTSSLSEPTTMLEDFISSVIESCNRLHLNNVDFVKELLSLGDMASLLSVLSGIAFIRAKLWKLNNELQGSPFRQQYIEVVDLMESSLSQLVEYQVNLIATTILHDAESQRWSDESSFYEDERISHCVQMWWYYLQGLRMDLWTSLPPKPAQSVLAHIFEKVTKIDI